MFELRNNSLRAKEISIIFGVLIGITILSIVSSTWQYNLLVGIKERPEDIDMPTIHLSDQFNGIVAISLLIIIILSIIYFIRWFRRAYFNLSQVPEAQVSFSEGWAAGAWFVPFLNLVRPFQIMREIWEGMQRVLTHRIGAPQSNVLIGSWWAVYLISNIYSNFTFRYSLRSEELDELIVSTRLDLIGHFLSLASAIITLVVIKRTANIEKELWEDSLTPTESVFSLAPEKDSQENY